MHVRRIIEGRLYNTATAKLVATDRYHLDVRDAGVGKPHGDLEDHLYVTKGGAFFLVTLGGERDQDGRFSLVMVEPQTREEVEHWWRHTEQAELHDETVFALPDEAAAEDAGRARVVTFTLRLPEPLRDRLQKAAAEQSLSINAYLIRCAEKCLRG